MCPSHRRTPLQQCLAHSVSRGVRLAASLAALSFSDTPFCPMLPTPPVQQCLGHNVSDVRLAAMKATCVFISELESAEERDKFQVGQPALVCSSWLGCCLEAGRCSSRSWRARRSATSSRWGSRLCCFPLGSFIGR